MPDIFFRQTFSKIVNNCQIKNTSFQVDENTFFSGLTPFGTKNKFVGKRDTYPI